MLKLLMAKNRQLTAVASNVINPANELDDSSEHSDAPWDDELGLADEMDSSDVFLSPEASVFFKGKILLKTI